MQTVNLYTMQHKDSLHELKKNKRIINEERFIRMNLGSTGDYIIPQYRIFSSLAKKIVERPKDVIFPIWCGVTKQSSFVGEKGHVIYCLTVPVDEVIYFDGGKWDYVLNNLYIPKDAEDAEAYAKELEDLGIESQYGLLTDHGGMYPQIYQKIRDSWERLFVIDDWNQYIIQANLWEIKEEWVRHVVSYGENLYEVASDMEDIFPPQFVLEQQNEADQ
ncbi:MAG: DUF3841 domain-containing protein [Atopococcus tabaci]|uniref:DUF3841 domain-containing protein n=1 Tax=Atopococcus tabaci TaxID=269774 RepID=A0AA43UCD6_9LACT|nr:DUF3841 domain-containing protein [Atopococcus tabaci]